jgi:hypothetical protein
LNTVLGLGNNAPPAPAVALHDAAVDASLAGSNNATLSWNNGLWAAGPAPRTRHVLAAGGAEEAAGRGRWLLREGGALLAADRAAIVEYDAAGGW